MVREALEVLPWLIALLPGIVAWKVVGWLCVRPKQPPFDVLVEALLHSLPIYLIFGFAFGVPEFKQNHVLMLGGLAVAQGLAWSWVFKNDVLGRVLRSLRFTSKTAQPSVWNDVFHNYTGYVLVELGDRRCVVGWIRYYSDAPNPHSLFLEDAAWVLPNQTKIQIEGSGILLTEAAGIRTVSFVNGIDTRQTKTAPAAAGHV